jgi:hypothetical protein
MWDLGISGVPPEAFPYIAGSYTMRTERLRQFLGPRYSEIMQHDVRSALADSFAAPLPQSEAAIASH